MNSVEYKNEEVILEVEEPQLVLSYNAQKVQKKSVKTLRMISLFSGCGGMDLGFEGGFEVHKDSINEVLNPEFVEKEVDDGFVELKKTKFKTVFANDILLSARNTWVNYFKDRGVESENFHSESIVDLVKLHKSGEKIFPEDVDIVTGGFPCQDFSIAGKRNGFNSHKNHLGELKKEYEATEETRGKLYMWMKEVIEITKPKVFVAENVKGLVNLSNVKDIIRQDFSSINKDGYFVFEPQVLHAGDYGVPQSRERVFFIGLKKSALRKDVLEKLEKGEFEKVLNPYPSPTHRVNFSGEALKPPMTVRSLFKSLREPELAKDLSQQYYSRAKYMGAHCQGQTEVKLDGLAPTIRAEHHGNIEFRRLSKSNGGAYLEELQQGLKERRLTLRECGLIQTFPRDFDFVIKSKTGRKKFLVSPSAAYKVVGNAVPPLLAYHLARSLESKWEHYFNN